jgi:hypothetical protein
MNNNLASKIQKKKEKNFNIIICSKEKRKETNKCFYIFILLLG